MKNSNEKALLPPAIEILSLTVHYGISPVLWDITCSIPQGVLAGIIGPNGAGKSTLLKTILGIVPPAVGGVRILGASFQEVHKKIAYVPQKEAVDWEFPITVYELAEMGAYPRKGLFGRMRREDRLKVQEALEKVGLWDMRSSEIRELSGGQQQRAFLARALVQDAALYLLDEPFAGVDHTSEETILRILKEMVEGGKSCVIIHHDLDTVRRYFDWIVLLNTRLIANGSKEEVMTPHNLRKAYGEQFGVLSEALRLSQEMG